jgi:hypothetical protein
MKIQITKSQKIELLKAIKTGVFDIEIFPELYAYEKAKILTKEEAREFLSDLENQEFEKVAKRL